MNYTYGLVCISEKLKAENKDWGFKSMTRKGFLDWRKKYANGKCSFTAEYLLEERIIHNIRLTQRILNHCAANDIFHYRLSSKLFPLVTDTTLNLSIDNFTNYSDILVELKQIGKIAKKHGITISIHPDQFNVLASKRPDVVQKTITELNFHARIMDYIGLPQDYSAPINIHPSTSTNEPTKENLREIVDRFYEAFKQCSKGVQKRLVVENEDKGCWNCGNLFMYFHNYCGTQHGHFFPLTYDNLHDYCNPTVFENQTVTQEQNVSAFAGTWKKNVPVFHFSWGKEENIRSHSDYAAENIPDYNTEIIWEVELKAKDYAIEYLIDGTLAPKTIEEAPKIAKKVVKNPKKVVKQKSQPKKEEPKEILNNLEKNDKQDAVYTAYNHVYGINT